VTFEERRDPRALLGALRVEVELGTADRQQTAMPTPPRSVTISAVSSIDSGRPAATGFPRTLRPVQ
jgi:hypothetical protein